MASVARGKRVGEGGERDGVEEISARSHNELTIKSTLKTHLANGHRQSKRMEAQIGRARAVRCRERKKGRSRGVEREEQRS